MSDAPEEVDWMGLPALERLVADLLKLSNGTTGRTTDWRGQQASLAFAKVGITCMTFLRLIPGSSHYGPAGQWAIWDLSAAASQCRNLIEAYHLLCYLGHEPGTPEEWEFREWLWEYHEEYERHEMLRAGVPDSKHLGRVAHEVAGRRARLEASPVFQKLSAGNRQRLLNAKDFKLEGPIELSRLAGVSENYYRSTYKYCSAFSHSAPFSISQLNQFRAGAPEATHVLGTLVNHACGYTALAIRDFIKLFPDQDAVIEPQTKVVISLWENLLKWEKSAHFGGPPAP